MLFFLIMNNITVIIPHKNSPTLLKRCVDSIPDLDTIEVIIIDDNSDEMHLDNFPKFNRKKIETIFSKTSLTAGGARNIGLNKATGNWILFADADDFFLKDSFTTFIDSIVKGVDIIYYKVSSVYSDTLKPATRHIGVNRLVSNFKNSELELRVKHIVPWGKMFSLDFIKKNNFTFDEVPASNDVFFGLLTGFNAAKIKVVEKEVYCITMNEGSLINTLSSKNNFSRYLVALRYNKFLREHKLNNFQNSVRPLFFNSIKFGIKDFIKYLKLLIVYKESLFYDLNITRSIKSFFLLKKNNKQHKKYITK